ncbi:MAG: hypothetical protein U9M97_04235 [Candidatus Hadarchaeota archaeon]|nr:hypothetical protein [Candidatus Hadarchaeota archaeon]
MKLLAGVVLASIFLGVFVGLYSTFRAGRSEADFRRDAEELVAIIESMSSLDPGTQWFFDVTVPDGCQLLFENTYVVAVTNGSHSYGTGVNLVGPVFGDGNWELTLSRTENGVEVSG